MEIPTESITDMQKEVCAITLMEQMLKEYSEKTSIPFDEAFFKFAKSYVYTALFDFRTELWKEGPDYLMGWFEEALVKEQTT